MKCKVKMPKSAIQISTPLRTQCRRISTNPGLRIERFSLIPKLDQSSSLFEFEDFQVWYGMCTFIYMQSCICVYDYACMSQLYA